MDHFNMGDVYREYIYICTLSLRRSKELHGEAPKWPCPNWSGSLLQILLRTQQALGEVPPVGCSAWDFCGWGSLLVWQTCCFNAIYVNKIFAGNTYYVIYIYIYVCVCEANKLGGCTIPWGETPVEAPLGKTHFESTGTPCSISRDYIPSKFCVVKIRWNVARDLAAWPRLA